MWSVDWTYLSKTQIKRVAKNHSREYESCLSNLDTILEMLNVGIPVGVIKFGHFRSERDGVYRIGQSGIVGAKETRLYLYFDEGEETIYVVGTGFKEGQSVDINKVKKLVRMLRK